ncbi:MAG: TIGR02996 domain-containing protein [Polyangiales bacterium]
MITARSEQDLFAAVLAAPDDDDCRLVLADYLQEKGDPRGEFIQIQCVLGSRLWGVNGRHPYLAKLTKESGDTQAREELQAREKKLLTKHKKEWLTPFREHIRTCTWGRGFVDTIVADAGKFIAGADAIFAHTPLSGAQLTALKAAHPKQLAALEIVSHLRSLDLSQQHVDAARAKMFESKVWTGLRELSLWGNPVGAAGVRVLAGCSSLAGLKRLGLSSCELDAEAIEALSRAPFFETLEHLHLEFNDGLGPAAARAITRGRSLVTLNLTRVGVGDEGIEAIAASSAMSNLESIWLAGNGIGASGIDALIRSPHLGKLREIRGLVGYAGGPEKGSADAERLQARFELVH